MKRLNLRNAGAWACALILGLFAVRVVAAAPAPSALRVALMDFSTDDNSWRNAQGAGQFTSLLQLQLASEPGVEWVERAQLELAREEMKLSGMGLLSGASSIRRGKWAKANWLLTGQFSLTDRNQRTPRAFAFGMANDSGSVASACLSPPGRWDGDRSSEAPKTEAQPETGAPA